MIILVLALQLAASDVERCATVRRDHEQFKAWAFSSLKQFESAQKGTPSAADRIRWSEFEKKTEARISELNRRYANCRED